VDLWAILLDILVLLFAAMVLGGLCERLKQSAILGYLLAGTLLGPNALNLMPHYEAVAAIAELGVALLLFTIGLEFSWRRLRSIGALALGGGTAQVLLTSIVAASVFILFDFNVRPALAIGTMIALSSTACVLRLLVSRAEIDSVYGWNAMGILLLQDAAVIPLVFVITILAGSGSVWQISWAISRAVGGTALFVGASYVVLNLLTPRLFSVREAAKNRELPILLAIVTATGASWAAHEMGLSSAVGAFIAGILLAGSPFATQIRGDVAPLRTLFVTLFFSAIGMLADPAWVLSHWGVVAAAVIAIVFGKTVLAGGIVFLFKSTFGHAFATGLCLAQVGEFSFVLAQMARQGELINDEAFKLIVSITIVTLFLTPYFVAIAPRLASAVGKFAARKPQTLEHPEEPSSEFRIGIAAQIVIVGFGPAGQRVAEALMKQCKANVVVVELNPKSAAIAQSYGLRTYLGDASRPDVLEHLGIISASMVVVTVPDPNTARQVIEQVRSLSPDTQIIVRSRYHVHRWQLALAGAQVVIDEEEQVGIRMAAEVRDRLLAEGGDPKLLDDIT